jgi:anaerobic magnesium-protoporphyrin IX monomethyl ester cyclase
MTICLATVHQSRRFIPLALLYIKAYLVERRHCAFGAVDVAEFSLDATAEDIVSRVLRQSPDVVGLSCYVWNITVLMEVSRRIKALRPNTIIVLGGPEVGPIAPSVLRRHPDVDIIVKSEGEIPFAELVERWNRGADVAGVKGICFRDGAAIVETEEAPPLMDLNHLASPHLAEYADHRDRVVCIETQRGCVFKCNFCFYNKDLSIRNRRFDLDRVKQEILFWLDRDVCQIYLMDPVFNLYAERTKDICRFVAEHNTRRLKFHAEVWAEFIDEELASLMRDANFTFLEVGLQTTDTTALATVERRLKLEKFLKGIGHLKRYDLPFELQLIYGLPGETAKSFRKSLAFAMSLDPPEIAVYPLMVLPGTELWRKAEVIGLQFDPEPPYYVRSHGSMTADEITYGWKIVSALRRFGNSKTMRLLGREEGLSYSDIVDSWIAWQSGQAEVPLTEQVHRFLSHFCREHDIPEGFYQEFAAREFIESPTLAPHHE